MEIAVTTADGKILIVGFIKSENRAKEAHGLYVQG